MDGIDKDLVWWLVAFFIIVTRRLLELGGAFALRIFQIGFTLAVDLVPAHLVRQHLVRHQRFEDVC